MTIRELLGRKRRFIFLLAYSCWVLFAVAAFTGQRHQHVRVLAIAPFLGGAGCVLFALYGLRCPNCKNNLGYTLNSAGSFWNISAKLKFCPFCGVDLDTKVNQLPSDGRAG